MSVKDKKGSETGAGFVVNEFVEKPSSKLAREYFFNNIVRQPVK